MIYLFNGEMALISLCSAGLHDEGREASTKSHVSSSNNAEQDLGHLLTKRINVNFANTNKCYSIGQTNLPKHFMAAFYNRFKVCN